MTLKELEEFCTATWEMTIMPQTVMERMFNKNTNKESKK